MKNNNQLAIGTCDKKGKGGKAMATATAIRAAVDKEGDGNKESNCVSDMGGVQ
jgi:hypothetical protein